VDCLDRALPAGEAGQGLRGSPVGVEAGGGVHDLLGDQRPVGVERVAAGADDPGGVREADAVGGGPQGSADGAAVAAAGVGVVRGGGVAFCLDLVEVSVL
jgi:hypothetical protein